MRHGASGGNRGSQFLEVGERFKNNAVCAAFQQRFDLFFERGQRIVVRDFAQRRQERADGSNRTEDEGRFSGDFARFTRQLDAAPVDLPYLVCQIVMR